ncbi:MAG: hypothetical protein LBK99_20970 [Opitutaceae bacterium]|nr:hypothetical protein [Opitutaceae bacterium]
MNAVMHPEFVPVIRRFAAFRGCSTSRMLEIAAIHYMEETEPETIARLRAKAPELFSFAIRATPAPHPAA